MSDSTDPTPAFTADDDEQQEFPDVEVTPPAEVDPDDGTDSDDTPVDNPIGRNHTDKVGLLQ